MNSLIVLGGGSSGWMTACYLKHSNPSVDVTLIDSPVLTSLVVGESTTPLLYYFFEDLGIPESEWMPACNATYKMGVIYKNWTSEGSTWFNSFMEEDVNDVGNNLYRSVLKEDNNFLDIAEESTDPSREGLWSSHAYHVDATLLSNFIKNKALALGVTFVEATVDSVTRNGNDVTGLIVDGVTYTADHYVDASGSSRTLIGNSTFTKPAHVSNHDKALAIRKPYTNAQEQMKPRTKATAMSAGWAWEVPLSVDLGCGYVYSSSFISDAEAKTELVNLLGLEADVDSFVVDISCGYLTEVSKGNVTAVGMAAGFTEPMEAGSLYVTQRIIEALNVYLETNVFQQTINDVAVAIFEDFADFISTTYKLANRTGPFWSQDFELSTRAQEWLDAQDTAAFSEIDLYFNFTFPKENWDIKLLEMGRLSLATTTLDYSTYKQNLPVHKTVVDAL